MDDTQALAVQEWAERRDDMLARAFAEGLSDQDVLALCEKEHLDLSPEAIAEKRAELFERTAAIVSVEGPRILRRVRHMNIAYRLREVENWLLQVSRGVAWAADTGHWQLVPKLVDAGLKGMRYMGEEADNIRATGEVEDRRRTQRLASLTPAERLAVQEHLQAIQDLVEPRIVNETTVTIREEDWEEDLDESG